MGTFEGGTSFPGGPGPPFQSETWFPTSSGKIDLGVLTESNRSGMQAASVSQLLDSSEFR